MEIRNKVIASLCVIFTILLFFEQSNSASKIEDLKENKIDIDSKILEAEIEVYSLTQDINTLYDDLGQINKRIGLVEEKREEKSSALVDINKDLSIIQNNIYESELEKQERENEFKTRLNVIYTRDSLAEWLNVLFNSEGFGSLLSNIHGYELLLEKDKNVIKDYTDSIIHMEEKKEEAAELINRIENLMEDLVKYDEELSQLKILNKKSMEQLNDDKENLKERIEQLSNISKELQNEITILEEKQAKLEQERLEKERLEKEKAEKKKEKNKNSNLDENINSIIEDVAEEYDLPPALIKGVIKAESGFDKDAVNVNTNGTMDRGIMQLNSNTAPWLAKRIGINYEVGVEFIPEYAIKMGALYLKDHWDKGNGITYTLTAYNRGPGGADKWFNNHGTYETEYSKKVKGFIEEFK